MLLIIQTPPRARGAHTIIALPTIYIQPLVHRVSSGILRHINSTLYDTMKMTKLNNQKVIVVVSHSALSQTAKATRATALRRTLVYLGMGYP